MALIINERRPSLRFDTQRNKWELVVHTLGCAYALSIRHDFGSEEMECDFYKVTEERDPVRLLTKTEVKELKDARLANGDPPTLLDDEREMLMSEVDIKSQLIARWQALLFIVAPATTR